MLFAVKREDRLPMSRLALRSDRIKGDLVAALRRFERNSGALRRRTRVEFGLGAVQLPGAQECVVLPHGDRAGKYQDHENEHPCAFEHALPFFLFAKSGTVLRHL